MDRPPSAYSQQSSSSQTTSPGSLVQNDPGPSSASPSATFKKPALGPKRRRQSSDANLQDSFQSASIDDSEDLEHDAVPAPKGSKKKKAVRACVHCQKAHLTCDDGKKHLNELPISQYSTPISIQLDLASGVSREVSQTPARRDIGRRPNIFSTTKN